jgi:hypothetical protein
MCWISPNTLDDFRFFHECFDRLGFYKEVVDVLDIIQTVRMYSGFLVSRSHCSQPNFHVDWEDTDLQAFTMLGPLTEVPPGFGLLYQRLDGSIAQYDYRLGKALLFGDGFLHSTQPGSSSSPVVLLSFTFGTDKMEYWERIATTAASQGNLVRRPDGSFLVADFDTCSPQPSRG